MYPDKFIRVMLLLLDKMIKINLINLFVTEN